MTTRYALEPLAQALAIQLLQPGWSCDDVDPTILRGSGGLAEVCGVTRRTIDRWATRGIPEPRADHLAVHCAKMHPTAIWADWAADEAEPDDGFPPLDDVDLDQPCRRVAA